MNAGSVAVVTGGGRGIGRGIVLKLASFGYRVVINYRGDLESATRTGAEAKQLGASQVLLVQADVSNPIQSEALVQKVVDELGSIDVWVNNAGVAPETRADLLSLTPTSWDRVLNTNLRGPFFLSQRVAAAMISQQRQPGQTTSMIIFVTSISSEFASVSRGEYCVSKAGLSMVAQLFAARLADHDIQVFEIRPGIIATDMTEVVSGTYRTRIAEGLTPIRRMGSPEDVGEAVGALVSQGFPFSTGQVFYVDGGMHMRRL